MILSSFVYSPFYGEDFFFEIPRPFQFLSFYVYAKGVFQRDLPVGKSHSWTRDVTGLSRVDLLWFHIVLFYFPGKVSIRKDDLCKYSGKDDWFNLQPVDPNTEVQVFLFFFVDILMYVTHQSLVLTNYVEIFLAVFCFWFFLNIDVKFELTIYTF